MKLNFAVNFSDLNSLKGLKKIDKIFLSYLEQKNLILHKKSDLPFFRLTK
jgi:hypothetical protein